jgi:hypothetical protein
MSLSDGPDAESNPSTRSEAEQRRFELMCSRQKQAQILHESGGHRNARDTYRDLEAAGVKVHHLKRYILANGVNPIWAERHTIARRPVKQGAIWKYRLS